MMVLVLPTAARDHLGKLDWLMPPLIRAAEFLTIILIGLAADTPKWLLYVLIYVIGYHTYDTVYRTRQSIWPPDWVFRAGLGWEIRLLLMGAGAALGVLVWVLAVLTLYLGVLFAVESVTSWVRLDKGAALAQAGDDLEALPRRSWSRPPETPSPPDVRTGHGASPCAGASSAAPGDANGAPRGDGPGHAVTPRERTATDCRGPLLLYTKQRGTGSAGS